MLKWRCPSQVFHAHWGPFQGAVNFCWSKKKIRTSYDATVAVIPWCLNYWNPQSWKGFPGQISSPTVHITLAYSWEFHRKASSLSLTCGKTTSLCVLVIVYTSAAQPGLKYVSDGHMPLHLLRPPLPPPDTAQEFASTISKSTLQDDGWD